MHIKEVTIQGFRSYKDQTAVEPFSHKHNVVVGKNGSGKSNFFKAIQFVLGDETEFGARLGADSRQSLLHEGTGNRVHTAYTEVIFDNSDSRIPVEGDEVKLRRTISAKQDQYTLNGKTSTKQDVANLLETAGFSKSNPYYIVKQGKVNELSTAAPEKRLALLYEVAGTKVYDERRKESQEAMKEAAEKSEQIHKAINAIEDRLKTLEEEKEELRKYQHLDKKRRVLEHTVFTKDLDEVRTKVASLEAKNEEKDSSLKVYRNEMRTCGDEIQKYENELRDAKMKVMQLEDEKRQVLAEQQEHTHRLTQLDLAIQDAETENEQVKSGKSRMEKDVRDLKDKIEQTELQLKQIAPEYEAAVAEEETANKELQAKKQRRTELYAKQNRGDRYKTKEDRDRYLNSELRRVTAAIAEKTSNIKNLQKKQETDQKTIQRLETKIMELETQVTERNEQYSRENATFYDDRRQKEELVSQKNELWRKQTALQQTLDTKREELRKKENDLRSLMGRPALRGHDAVQKVLKQWEQKQDKQHVIDGYHGMLIECILADENVFTAVDTTAGGKLFYHIVETDTIASEILDEVNRQNLPGEVNFLPLNRLNVRDQPPPDLGDVQALPLINKIRYEAAIASAAKFVFGKTLVCRHLDIATELCKDYNMDCVTPDGDTASRRGTITGGYVNRRESRMLIQKQISEMRKEESKLAEEKAVLDEEVDEITGRLNIISGSLSTRETKLERVRAQNEKNKMELNARKEELRTLQSGLEPKERSITANVTEIVTLEASKMSWERELGTELTSVLSEEERLDINSLDQQIREFSKHIKTLFEKRRKLELKKNNLQSSLQDDYSRRLDELRASLQDSSTDDSGQRLLSLRRDKNVVEQHIRNLQQRITQLDEELDERIEERRLRAEKVDKLRTKERELQEKIMIESRELDKIINKLVLMQKEKDDCLHKIRELVALPAGVDNTEYMRKSSRELGKDLDKVNEELKKFGHVNQRALDQYVTFSEQRAKLLARRDEQDRGAKSIVELMQNLEQQKYEAIMLTFKQVTRNFEMVFKDLVPHGRGNLTLLQGSQESSIEDTQPSMEELDKFTGIGVRVTFTGGVGEMKDMHQLSGGQKTLVALATIFAIQRCDPAPFYLFDEIDQNLDPDHRKSVGRMIERLSTNAQFITTTFRAELLDHADKFYGVKYDPVLKISRIAAITKVDAQEFIADDESDLSGQLPSSSAYRETTAPASSTNYDSSLAASPSQRPVGASLEEDSSDASRRSRFLSNVIPEHGTEMAEGDDDMEDDETE